LLLRSRNRPLVAGGEALIGAEGETISWHDGEGRVRVRGEIWLARSDSLLRPGNRVKIIGRDGLVLRVEAIRPA
jgi:membrane-bound serine protease (ClpP class)